jgi:hypothetical protein
MAGALLVSGVYLTACSGDSGPAVTEDAPPASLADVPGQEDIKLITLTDEAMERIGLETAEVKAQTGADGTAQRAVPFASLIYDPEGATFVYVNDAHAQFMRAPVTVVRINGDEVLLSDGPPAGDTVVTVGAAQLYGVESDFEEE